MKKIMFVVSLMVIMVSVIGGGIAYQKYQERAKAHEKELEFEQFCFYDCVHEIDLLKDRCKKYQVSVDFSDLTHQKFLKDEQDNPEAIRAATQKNGSVLYEMQKRYIRSISKRIRTIKSVEFDGNIALIKYLQLTEEEGKRFDTVETSKLNLYSAMAAIEDGFFQYGRTILYRYTRDIINVPTLVH